MQRPFSERRYSDEELSRILDDAANAEARGTAGADRSEGHTLDEIREIAREAGIDLDEVDRAAARLVAGAELGEHLPAERTKSRSGRSSRIVHEERVISRALSDAEMRMLAQQMEVVTNKGGRIREWGDWVEWREDKDRLYVGIVRGNGQTRIRVIADHYSESLGGLVAIGFVAFLLAGATPGPAIGLPLLVMAVAAAWKYWGWRGDSKRAQLTELLDSLEDSLRTR